MKKIVCYFLAATLLFTFSSFAFADNNGNSFGFDPKTTNRAYDELAKNEQSFTDSDYTRTIFAAALLTDAFQKLMDETDVLFFVESVLTGFDVYIGYGSIDDADTYWLGTALGDSIIMLSYSIYGESTNGIGTGFLQTVDNATAGQIAMKHTINELTDQQWDIEGKSYAEALGIVEDIVSGKDIVVFDERKGSVSSEPKVITIENLQEILDKCPPNFDEWKLNTTKNGDDISFFATNADGSMDCIVSGNATKDNTVKTAKISIELNNVEAFEGLTANKIINNLSSLGKLTQVQQHIIVDRCLSFTQVIAELSNLPYTTVKDVGNVIEILFKAKEEPQINNGWKYSFYTEKINDIDFLTLEAERES